MGDPAAPVSTRKGDASAARIREAALDQFSRLGFERVTMGGIAQAAGVSQATLHYHFQDKDQLWRAAVLGMSAAIAQEEEAVIAVARDAPVLARLRMAMRLFLRISRKHPALGRIVALEGMAGGERLKWLDENLSGPRNRRFLALLNEAIVAGVVRPCPAELLLVTLQAGAAGVINLAPMLREVFGVDPDDEAARAAHEDLVVDGLLGGVLTGKSG
jgi:AcrR family transcriptional regulator